jgi:uncharacterized protein DUF5666
MVSTYVFAVDAATQYSGGTCANIQTGSKINFNGVRDSQTSTVFHVAQLAFTSTSTPPSPAPTPTPTPTPTIVPVQTEATITSIGSGVCPEVQFFVGTYALNVSYATAYSGGACGDLKAGTRVGIVGARKDTESFIRVSRLTFVQPATTPPPTPGAPPPQPVDGEGVITAIGEPTACPSRNFYIGMYLVKLDATTQYVGGGCASLQVGLTVGVKGTVLAERTVAASVIALGPGAPPTRPQAEGEGVVGAVVNGTSCPALQFTIGEYTVTVEAATVFSGGSCTRIGPGKLLHVIATMTGDRQALASQVTFKN